VNERKFNTKTYANIIKILPITDQIFANKDNVKALQQNENITINFKYLFDKVSLMHIPQSCNPGACATKLFTVVITFAFVYYFRAVCRFLHKS